MKRTGAAAAVVALGLCGAAQAHPHVFVEGGLTFLTDGAGHLAAVEVYWAYDDLFSMLFLAENGLLDGGDAPDPAALAALAGQDAPWGRDGFDGDLVLSVGGAAVALSGPLRPGLTWQDGRLVSHHIRALPERVAPGAGVVQAQMYDPGYYVAYTLSLPVAMAGGGGCEVLRLPADLNAAYSALDDLMYGPGGAGIDGDDFPAVGDLFAETVELRCPGG